MSRSLPEWLAYIEVLHDRAWDPGLDRVGEVGRRLNVLHPGKHTILVAGTNGKGSTCEYIERLALKTRANYGQNYIASFTPVQRAHCDKRRSCE